MACPTLRQSTMIQIHDHISLTHVHTHLQYTSTIRANCHILTSTSLVSIPSKPVLAPKVCEECGKSFTLVTNLSRHKKVHEREHDQKLHGKPLITSQTFVCDICRKCLNAKSSLNQHVKIHLDKCLNCDTCSATFKTEQSLNQHRVNVHTQKTYHVSCQSK